MCKSFRIFNSYKTIAENNVGEQNVPISTLATKVVQQCLNEDSLLFLRILTDQISDKKVSPDSAIILLVKLFSLFQKQSAWELHRQSKKILANYLIGLIMTLLRTFEKQDRRINQVMPLLEGILPQIYGLTLKQLKVTLRKEQCDMKIMVSSSTTGTKKITCFGPDEHMIPNQVEISNDEFKFSDLLQEGLEFYNLHGDEKPYFLKDTRLNKLLNPSEFVKDHFPFRKGSIPQGW